MKNSIQPGEKQKRTHSRLERGQSIVIITAAFIGILAFIGLAVDFGILLSGKAHLKRAVDAAALAAATQYRSGIDSTQLADAANEFLRLNGVNLDNISSSVETCSTNPGDTSLCTTPPRKLVRVIATAQVDFVFLPVVGIYHATISDSSIAEAAAMDVVLVIDISESMSYDGLDLKAQDPAYCNNSTSEPCMPFNDVKTAAKNFADQILNKSSAQEEDRLSIVIFSDGWEVGKFGTQVVDPCGTFYNGGGNCPTNTSDPGYADAHSGWITSQSVADNVIESLQVYTPPVCDQNNMTANPGLCRNYDTNNNFTGMNCPWSWSLDQLGYNDYSTCTTTDTGDGLKLAGEQFENERRSDSLWVTILLTDGAANATELTTKDDLGNGLGQLANPINSADMINSLPIGYCPEHMFGQFPSCRDVYVSTRHNLSADPNNYDADDYARDEADFVGCDPNSPAAGCNGTKGQGAVIYAIGLGSQVLTQSSGDHMAYGDSLLRYVAAVGDDGDPTTNPCSGVPVPTLPLSTTSDKSYNCGNYFFAQYSGYLNRVFNVIYSRIYTRISQ